MTNRLDDAALLRDEATWDRKANQLDDAKEKISRSVKILKELWKERKGVLDKASKEGREASPDDKELLEDLAETFGVMGGIYRSRQEYLKAIDAYDEGERYEQHPAGKGDNSYNLMQRLLNRALLDPGGAGNPDWTVHNVNMKTQLERAEAILTKQRTTTRIGDAWAAADQALAHALLASLAADASPHRDALDRACDALDDKTPLFVFDSTLRAMRDAQREFKKVGDQHSGAAIVAEMLTRCITRLERGFETARAQQSLS